MSENHRLVLEEEERVEGITNVERTLLNLASRVMPIPMQSTAFSLLQKRLETNTGGHIARSMSRSSMQNKRRRLSERGSLDPP